jgi:hypothetical protein
MKIFLTIFFVSLLILLLVFLLNVITYADSKITSGMSSDAASTIVSKKQDSNEKKI